MNDLLELNALDYLISLNIILNYFLPLCVQKAVAFKSIVLSQDGLHKYFPYYILTVIYS